MFDITIFSETMNLFTYHSSGEELPLFTPSMGRITANNHTPSHKQPFESNSCNLNGDRTSYVTRQIKDIGWWETDFLLYACFQNAHLLRERATSKLTTNSAEKASYAEEEPEAFLEDLTGLFLWPAVISVCLHAWIWWIYCRRDEKFVHVSFTQLELMMKHRASTDVPRGGLTWLLPRSPPDTSKIQVIFVHKLDQMSLLFCYKTIWVRHPVHRPVMLHGKISTAVSCSKGAKHQKLISWHRLSGSASSLQIHY